MTSVRSTHQERIHALDALRAAMMLLGLVLHAAISYSPLSGGADWPFRDAVHHSFFAFVVGFIHAFRMPVFFAIAGFFAALLYVRQGARALALNRARRILVPFVVGWLVLIPLIKTGFTFSNTAQQESLAAGLYGVLLMVARLDIYARHTSHLWFLYYLLWFYLVGLVAAPALIRLPASMSGRIREAYRHAMNSRWRPLLFCLPTALILYLLPPTEQGGFVLFRPSVRVFFGYGVYFGFGWLLYLERDLLPSFGRNAWTQVGLASALVLLRGFLDASIVALLPTQEAVRVTSLVVSVLTAWLFVFGITGLFLRYLNRPRALVRYIVDASYWIYLIHLPFMIWIPGLLARLDWPAWLKMLFVLALSTPFLWVSYEFGVRCTVIGEMLNGRRYPRGLPAVEPSATNVALHRPEYQDQRDPHGDHEDLQR